MKTKNMCKVIEKFLTTHEHFETIELAKEIESQLKADFIEQDYIHRGEKTTERDYYYYTNGAQSREQEIREMQMKNDELKGLLQISDKEILQLKNKLEISNEAIYVALSNPEYPDDKMFELIDCKVGYCKGEALARLAELKEVEKC